MRLTNYIVESQASIYRKLKGKGPWVIVSQEGELIQGKLKDYNKAYKAWEKHGKRTFMVNVELSDEKSLGVVMFPRTQKQPAPFFNTEPLHDIGFTGDWQRREDLGKDKGKANVY
jgi:hypothetical protein